MAKQREREEQEQERLAAIKAVHASPKLAPPTPPRQRDIGLTRADANRRNAARLKAMLAYRATLEESQTELISIVEEDIRKLRAKARGDADPRDLREELFKQLAKAQVTLDRARSHCILADQRRDAAAAEVARIETELSEFKPQQPPPPEVDAQGLITLASLLTSLRQGATDAGDSRFMVKGSILDGMVNRIQKMAMPRLPQPATPPSATQRAQTPPSRRWADIFSTDEEAQQAPMDQDDSAFFSAALSEESPSDTELRAYCKKFARTPQSETRKALIKGAPYAKSHKKRPPTNASTVWLSPVREQPPSIMIGTPDRNGSRQHVPDMPDDF